MAKKKWFDFTNIEFPLKGLNRKWSYQRQPQYTTPDALNVWPFTKEDMRMRGGSRPGTGNWANTGMAGKVNMLSSVNGSRYRYVAANGDSSNDGNPVVPEENVVIDDLIPASFFDDFTGSVLRTYWESAFDCVLPDLSGNPPEGRFHAPTAAVRTKMTYSVNDPVSVSMTVSSISGWSDNGKYTLACGLHDNAPSLGGGVCAELTKSDGAMSAVVKVNGSSVYSGAVDGARGGSLMITLRPDGSATVGYCGKVLVTTEAAVMPGTRFGFKLEAADEGCVAAIDSFAFNYYENVDNILAPDEGGSTYDGTTYKVVLDKYADILVAGVNGDIWFSEEGPGFRSMRKVESAIKTQQTGYVMAQKRLREMFVADYGELKGIGTDGVIASSVLSAPSVTDWTTMGIVTGSDIVVITDATSGVIQGSYVISEVTTAGIRFDGYTGTDGTGTWRICVSPKVYSHSQKSYAPFMATTGMVPVNCPIVCLYRDRLVMAGAPSEPHLWYMSRLGDPYDWDYALDVTASNYDTGAAIAGQSSAAGIIGEPIRAICPHSDDYLVFGYDRQLWVLRGDPGNEGQLDNLSYTVGIVGRRAWCYGHSGEIIFLAKDGLYSLVNAIEPPQMISHNLLPDELKNMGESDNIQMSYDHEYHGIHIYSETRNRHWFFSLDTSGLWPMEHSSAIVCTAVASYEGKLIIGTRDGWLKTYDKSWHTDDGVSFSSYVVLGPFRVFSSDYSVGVVQKMCTTMLTGNEPLSIGIISGNEAVDVQKMYEEGKVYVVQTKRDVDTLLVRERGGSMALLVGKEGFTGWGMERIGLYVKIGGGMK